MSHKVPLFFIYFPFSNEKESAVEKGSYEDRPPHGLIEKASVFPWCKIVLLLLQDIACELGI